MSTQKLFCKVLTLRLLTFNKMFSSVANAQTVLCCCSCSYAVLKCVKSEFINKNISRLSGVPATLDIRENLENDLHIFQTGKTDNVKKKMGKLW